jgi:hypothetical protein
MAAALIFPLLLSAPVISRALEAAPSPSSDVRQPKSTAKTALSKPLWRDLDAAQQQALYPLGTVWDGLSEAHKRKWLALSRNHAKLSPAEQAVQHSRMAEWATLGVRERAQARFNFVEIKQLPPAERKAKWEAYQALSAEEKRKLAERAPPQSLGVAPTIRPVPAHRLAPVRLHDSAGAAMSLAGETNVPAAPKAAPAPQAPAIPSTSVSPPVPTSPPAGDRSF